MTKTEREQLKGLKREATSIKSSLLRLASEIDNICPREAERLSNIVGRLESWQHSGTGAL
jgi:hypothetical protein